MAIDICVRQKYFFVNARNNYVKAELRKIYSGHSLNIRPDIFCIANQDYRGSDIQKSNKDALSLTIQNSGVPELRRFCHSVMAKAKFEEANHYLRNQVFGLVESIELWLDVASKPDHSSIPMTCGEALKEVILVLQPKHIYTNFYSLLALKYTISMRQQTVISMTR